MAGRGVTGRGRRRTTVAAPKGGGTVATLGLPRTAIGTDTEAAAGCSGDDTVSPQPPGGLVGGVGTSGAGKTGATSDRPHLRSATAGDYTPQQDLTGSDGWTRPRSCGTDPRTVPRSRRLGPPVTTQATTQARSPSSGSMRGRRGRIS